MFLNRAFASTLPLQGTEIAARWDSLWDFLVWLSVFFTILVVGATIVFAIKYRRSAVKKTRYITGNHWLEVLWATIPTILLMIIFGWGYVLYNQMTRAPQDAYEIRVIGKQWLWQFQYDDGRTTVNELYVPMNRPVKLVMTSDDVIHSFFIPNFRVKQDVVPGMYTSVWFEATIPGKHIIFCTEYCGTSHSEMLAKAIVLDDAQWKAWRAGKKIENIPAAGLGGMELAAAPKATGSDDSAVTLTGLAAQGKALVQNKGCVACHSNDGAVKIGPSFKASYGRKVEFADGTSADADDNYMRESIENPQAKVVKGFNPVMPTFKGLLTEIEMNAVIAYIKSLK